MATEQVNTIFQAKDGITTVVKSIEKTVVGGFKAMIDGSKKANKALESLNFKQTIQTAIAMKNEMLSLGRAFGEFAGEGAKIRAVESTFKSLSGGLNANALQADLQGTIDKMTIMSAANKGLLLGLPVTKRSMKEMGDVARVLGQVMAQDASTSLNDLITGFGRGSAMILDNLGIVVDSTEAYKQYAESINKSVDALTSQEKKLAVFNAGMDAAKRKISDFRLETNEVADSFDQAKTAWADLVDELKKNTVTSGLLSAFANFVQQKYVQPIRDINFKDNLGDKVANLQYNQSIKDRIGAVKSDTSINEMERSKRINELYGQLTVTMKEYLHIEEELSKARLELRAEQIAENTAKVNAETQSLLDKEKEMNQVRAEGAAIMAEIEAKRSAMLEKDKSGTRNDQGYAMVDSPEVIQIKQMKVNLLDMENLKLIELANNGERLSTVTGRQFQTEQLAIQIKREYLELLNMQIKDEQALALAKKQQTDATFSQAASIAGAARTAVGENAKAAKAIAAVQAIIETAWGISDIAFGRYYSGAMHLLSAATFFKVSGGGGAARSAGGGGSNAANNFNPLSAPQTTRQQPTIVIHTNWDQNGFNTTVDGRAVNAVAADVNKGGQIMRTFQTAAGRF